MIHPIELKLLEIANAASEPLPMLDTVIWRLNTEVIRWELEMLGVPRHQWPQWNMLIRAIVDERRKHEQKKAVIWDDDDWHVLLTNAWAE